MNTQPVNFAKILLPLVIATTLGAIGPSVAIADITNINPIKDNTLYEFVPADGDRSNALGFHFFTGETGMGELRRGVLAFDIAGNIPAGSAILGVTLTLNMSMTPSGTARTTELHNLLADWGEGTSQASGGEGEGAPATTNDATWRHRFYDTVFWTTQGGDFSNMASASQSVGAIGDYTWSSAQMAEDVQSWLDNPITNFGWLVLGDESLSTTAKRFDTRESNSPPVLTIEYMPPPTPTPSPTATPTPPQCFGELITILDETFDSVTPPALPAGWTATNTIDPDGILWQSSNAGVPSPPADSPPNAAWVNDPAVVSDKYLDCPGLNTTESKFVWLTFRHNFNL